MRTILILLMTLVSLPYKSMAQKWDAVWVIGNDETAQNTGGGTLLDFSSGNLQTYFAPKRFHSDGSNTSICDKFGNLQFYSNGCIISNREHQMMENGEIHDGYYTDGFCADSSLDISNAVPQSILALPNGSDDSTYFLINRKLDAPPGLNAIVGSRLYLNIIDMRANGGLGRVTEKHIEILADTTEDEGLQAVRHANGRDWWIITPKFRSNCYYVILLDAWGNTTVSQQCIGTEFGAESWLGQSTFSPDGSRFVRFHWKYNLNLFDFDRCTGVLSNALAVPFTDIEFGRAGCAFSRSGRYLYTTTHAKLFQFDMQATDIAASRLHIADYDSFSTPFKTRFYMANLALDGKVYVGCPGQHKHIHVINEPERLGTACDFRQHAIELFTSNFWSFPNQSHTRIGPIDGSTCDSLGLDSKPWAFFRWETSDTLVPQSISFVDLSGYNPTSWYWDFGDGATSTETNPIHQYDSNGVYRVCLVVNNTQESDTICQDLFLGVSASPHITQATTVRVQPNPFQDYIEVQLGNSLGGSVFKLFDCFGRNICTHQLTSNNTKIDLPYTPNGIYFWAIEHKYSRRTTGKLIKTM